MDALPLWRQQALGACLSLLQQSPLHRHMTVDEIGRRLEPAIERGQIMFHAPGGVPSAFATWAYLTPQAARAWVEAGQLPAPDAFSAGTEAWLIDLVAPFGGLSPIVRDLRRRGLPGRSLHRRRRGRQGRWRAVAMWPGEEGPAVRIPSSDALAAIVSRHAGQVERFRR